MDPGTKEESEPDQIPPSVFTTTMTSKQEWSIQSNESLFSIHMDQSFTKLFKSGEFTIFDYTASYINNDNNTDDNKTTLTEVGTGEANVETGHKTAYTDTVFNFVKPDPPPKILISPIRSYRSNTCNISSASFAFPTLPEYQQDRKKQLNLNKGSGNSDTLRPDSKPDLNQDDPKPQGGDGWFSCFLCFR